MKKKFNLLFNTLFFLIILTFLYAIISSYDEIKNDILQNILILTVLYNMFYLAITLYKPIVNNPYTEYESGVKKTFLKELFYTIKNKYILTIFILTLFFLFSNYHNTYDKFILISIWLLHSVIVFSFLILLRKILWPKYKSNANFIITLYFLSALLIVLKLVV